MAGVHHHQELARLPNAPAQELRELLHRDGGADEVRGVAVVGEEEGVVGAVRLGGAVTGEIERDLVLRAVVQLPDRPLDPRTRRVLVEEELRVARWDPSPVGVCEVVVEGPGVRGGAVEVADVGVLVVADANHHRPALRRARAAVHLGGRLSGGRGGREVRPQLEPAGRGPRAAGAEEAEEGAEPSGVH